ncbi:MAG: peptide deformylase [Gammaproteobacteria bacterium]|nr:peptide deformylase [Gammaproteobacteria bacterium]
MAARKILRIGHPLLLQKSQPVRVFNTHELDQLIEDLFDTMAENDGAGLAAPQIGEMLRVVVFDVENNPRYPDKGPVPRTVLINPTIEPLDPEMSDDWEGCLSVPGMRGVVSRYTHIHYVGYDSQGHFFEKEVEGFHARVVQHECDHLDGVLYPQRIKDMRLFGYNDEILKKEVL